MAESMVVFWLAAVAFLVVMLRFAHRVRTKGADRVAVVLFVFAAILVLIMSSTTVDPRTLRHYPPPGYAEPNLLPGPPMQ